MFGFCGSGPWAGHSQEVVSASRMSGPSAQSVKAGDGVLAGPEPSGIVLVHVWQLTLVVGWILSCAVYWNPSTWPLHGVCTWVSWDFLSTGQLGSESGS